MKKVNKQIKITLGIMIPLLIGYFIYVNYWEYIENLLWNEDYDQRAMNYNYQLLGILNMNAKIYI